MLIKKSITIIIIFIFSLLACSNNYKTIDYSFQVIEVGSFSEGVATVRVVSEKTKTYNEALMKNKVGYIDKTGKIVIEPKFSSGNNFSNEMALVAVDNRSYPCYIDKAGNIIIRPKEEQKFKYHFSGGLACFEVIPKTDRLYERFGFIDKGGYVVIEPQFWTKSIFVDGIACVTTGLGLFYYIDKYGRNVFGKIFNNAYSFSDGLAAVSINNNKYGYIDRSGEIVIDCEYDYADSFSDGLALVKKHTSKYEEDIMFINKKGKVQFKVPESISIIRKFSEGLALVEVDKKWGFIDKTGKIVIEPAFVNAESFSEGLAKVCLSYRLDKNNIITYIQWGYINTTGEVVIELPPYTSN